MTEIAGFCTLCRSRCGTINVVEDGRLVAVRANPAHPTGKATCLKGRAAPEIAHSARRLTTPLRRTAPKGAADPGFVPISWDEALDEIAGRLGAIRAETGAESVAFACTSPSSSSMSDSYDWVWRFIRLFGSPNAIFSTELCNWHKDFAHVFTFGTPTPTADYRNADLILLWGHNPSNVWLAQAEAISAAQARGARIVVIDPRQTALAARADIWLRVRPGTDGALAMGVANAMIRRGLFNRDFVRDHTNAAFLVREDNGMFLRARDLGESAAPDDYLVWSDAAGGPAPVSAGIDESFLAGRGPVMVATVDGPVACRTAFAHFAEAVAPFDDAAMTRICGVGTGQVAAFAELMGAAGAIAYHAWTGVGQHANATQTERSIATLYALTDSYDKPGGNVRHPAQPVPLLHDISMIPAETRKKTLGLAERPLGPPAQGWITGSDFYDAVLDKRPYAVRGLFSFGANLLVSQPDDGRGKAALEALEFHVHCNIFMNPTAELADIVLPVSVPWENEALRAGFEISHEAQELIQLRPAMIPRLGEARSDAEIVFALAERMGFDDPLFKGGIEAGNAFILEPLGLTLAELRANPAGIRRPLPRAYQKYKTAGFPTETKKVELYSEKLHRHGYPAVPEFVAPYGEDADHPIVMFSTNNGYFCHSQHRGITSLRQRRPDPLANIHPETAREHGVGDGEWMTVTTETGSFQIRAAHDAQMAPGTLACDYGWWEAAHDLGLAGGPAKAMQTYNQAVSDKRRDPVSGGLPLRSTRCRIEAIPEIAWKEPRAFTVKGKRHVTPDTVALDLEVCDCAPLPAFRPGQGITVGTGSGRRTYSLTSLSRHDGGDVFSVAVKRVRDGTVSPSIVDRLSPGDRVEVGPPSGRFVIPERNEFPVVMLAGGIGITPFMHYLRDFTGPRDGAPPRVVLLYYCRDVANTPFFDELDALAKARPWLDIRLYLTGAEPVPFGRGMTGTGRFTPEHVGAALLAARARFYICAAEGMIDSIRTQLGARGVPKFEIFSEKFVSPGGGVVPDLVPRDVTLLRSGRTLRWTPEAGSLLEMADKAGITLASGCRVGQCESCLVKVVKGAVTHAQDVEIEDDECLTCIARPTSDIVLDA